MTLWKWTGTHGCTKCVITSLGCLSLQAERHPSLVVFLRWTLLSICHRPYFHTSKGHVTWIIKKVNMIPTHCGVVNKSGICHRPYFHTSKGHVTWIIKKANMIPTQCGVANESVHSLARDHVIRVWQKDNCLHVTMLTNLEHPASLLALSTSTILYLVTWKSK